MAFTGFLLTLSSLTVSPDRSQFFKYESLSLSCETDNPSAWIVKARTARGASECGRNWGLLQASTCIISEAYSWNSGEYWCESTAGGKSPAANIAITDSTVILESPVFPVTEGESVTLRCTTQSNSSTLRASIFMKDRSPVDAAVSGQMTIPAVSKADEGLYMCRVTDVGVSAESWLAVRERSTDTEATSRSFDGFTVSPTELITDRPGPDPPAAAFMSASRLTCHLVVGVPYLLSSVLLGLVYRDKAKAQRAEEIKTCDEVQMEHVI